MQTFSRFFFNIRSRTARATDRDPTNHPSTDRQSASVPAATRFRAVSGRSSPEIHPQPARSSPGIPPGIPPARRNPAISQNDTSIKNTDHSGSSFFRGSTIFADMNKRPQPGARLHRAAVRLGTCQTQHRCNDAKSPDTPPAAADARRRSGHRNRKRHRLSGPAYEQTPALLLARTLGRSDDLRLAGRALPRGGDRPLGRMGHAPRRCDHRGEFLRRHPADRSDRPPGPLVREPPRGAPHRGDGPPPAQPASDAHGRHDSPGHRHPQLPRGNCHLHLGRGQPHARRGHRRGHRHPQHPRGNRRLDSDLLRHGRPREGLPAVVALGTGRTGRGAAGLSGADTLPFADAHGVHPGRGGRHHGLHLDRRTPPGKKSAKSHARKWIYCY